MISVNAARRAESECAGPLQSHSQPEGLRITELAIVPVADGDGKRSGKMSDELKRYWFVVAVFRDPFDLAATVGDLRVGKLASDKLLVIANNCTGDVRKAADGGDGEPINVVVARPDGGIGGSDELALSPGLGALLRGMEASAPSNKSQNSHHNGEPQSQVYAQLLQEVGDGAIVLVASVADPEQQLWGARTLLRGNCECVLTHEIADVGS